MRRLRLSSLFGLLALAVAAPALRADLVWSPARGWRVEGGAVSAFTGEGGRNALDLMNRARSAEEAERYHRAVKLYKRVANNYTKSIFAPEACFRMAQAQISLHDYTGAFASYQQIMSLYPNYGKFGMVVGEQYRLASALANGSRGRMLWGLLPGTTHREHSIVYFEQVVTNAPYSDYAPLALMNVARLHLRFGNKIEAVDALDRMINFYPQSILTPAAYLQMAKTHISLVDGPEYDQFSAKEASTYFQDFLILYPGDPNTEQAEKGLAQIKSEIANSKIKIAEFYHYKRKNYIAAKVLYNEAITTFPDSAVAKKARARLDAIAPKVAEQEALMNRKPTDKPAPKHKRFLGLF